MNKKLNNRLSVLLLATVLGAGLWSCTKETNITPEVSESGDYPVSITLRGVTTASPKTYGMVGAEAFESNLTTTHALIFSEESKYLGIRPVTVSDVQSAGDATHDTKAKATFDLGSSLGSDGKTIRFVFVGNLDTSDFTTNMEKLRVAQSKTSINDLTLDDIKTLQITQAPDRHNHFVMLGQPQGGGVASVTVKRNIPQNYGGVIDMERLSARIDVKIGAGTNNAGLQVTGVKLMKKQGHSYLYEKGGNSSGTSLTSGEVASVMYSESPFEKKIYTYENSVAEATYVEVSLSLNGVALKPVTVPFTGKAIERNHIYMVSLDRDPNDNPDINPDINQPRIMFKVDVNDWNADYRYIENYADESAPQLVKVQKSDYTWSEPLGDIPVKVLDAQNVTFHVDETRETYLLLDVESKSTQSVGVVTDGSSWMTLSDVTTYGGIQQQYRLTLTSLDPSQATRVGKLEFRNKLRPEHKIVVTVSQGQKPNYIVPDKPSGLKLPLEYVADYNVNKERTGFLSTHSSEVNFKALLNVESALSVCDAPAFREYHIPSKEEWLGIIPSPVDYPQNAQGLFDLRSATERVKVGTDEIKDYVSDYRIVPKGNSQERGFIIYGLRYQGHGNKIRSAWRYTIIPAPEQSLEQPYPKDNLFEVRCIYLGPGFSGRLEDISSEAFWTANENKVVIRYFSAAGSIFQDTSTINTGSDKGESGYYFSRTIGADKWGYVAAFESFRSSPSFATCNFTGYEYQDKDAKYEYDSQYSVRLFHGRRVKEAPLKPSDIKLPPEYVALTDVNSTKDGFTKIPETDFYSTPGYFPYSVIKRGLDAPAFSDYHLPSKEEWMGIVPANGYIFSSPVSEEIKIGDEDIKSYTSVYKRTTKTNVVAIRLQGHGDKYRSAWRYSFQRIGVDWGFVGRLLRIDCIYLGPDSDVTIEDISDYDFWYYNRAKMITRTFMPAGYYEKQEEASEVIGAPFSFRSLGAYPSSSVIDQHSAYFLDFDIESGFDSRQPGVRSIKHGVAMSTGFQEYCYPVRLFKNP